MIAKVAVILEVLCRELAQIIVRLFYPARELVNGEGLPAGGPTIYVSNHVNGLMDPLLIRVIVRRPARFLAKSSLFGNPFGRLAMNAFGCVTIHRAHDAGGGGLKARAAANELAFARCREVLSAGQALALFPEGVSHSEPRLMPLKKGAARIALSAEREHRERTGQPLGLVVVPLGLRYQDKATFRSAVRVVVGAPIAVADLLSAGERAAEEALTERMRAALAQVVLQADSRELLEGAERVVAWTSPPPEDARQPSEHHRKAQALIDVCRRRDGEADHPAHPIVKAGRAYARVLRHVRVREPWALERSRAGWRRTLGAGLRLLLAAPVALVGAILGGLPYRLAGYVATRITDEEDMVATLKMLAGALFLFLFWLAEAVVAGFLVGPAWSLPVFVAAVASGYVALRFEEWFLDAVRAARHAWLRATRSRLVRRLAARRQALAAEVARVAPGGSDTSTARF